jgi:hypothetical protein
VQRTWGEQFGFKNDNLDFFMTLGLRYDFYTDDATKAADRRNCATPVAAALCRYSNGVANGNCAAPPPGCR